MALVMAQRYLNTWLGLFIFVTGNFSCLGNFLVLLSRAFRGRAYSVYRIGANLHSLIYIDFVLTSRIIQNGFGFPLSTRHIVLCKLRPFFAEYAPRVAFTLFELATIDRILSAERSMGKYKFYRSLYSLVHRSYCSLR
jgi:hypothetical protein